MVEFCFAGRRIAWQRTTGSSWNNMFCEEIDDSPDLRSTQTGIRLENSKNETIFESTDGMIL